MKASELSRQMAESAQFVAEYLFPAGKRNGREWRVGSLAGEEGQSLGISTAGSKAGLWCDFATGESGDLLDLWMKVRNCDLAAAMKQAADLLNIPQERPVFVATPKHYAPPKRVKCATPKSESPVTKYLLSRGLMKETIDLFKVGDGGDKIIFPFFHGGEVRMIKQLMLDRKDGKKDIRPTSANQMPCLFGWQAIDPKARTVVICEGEIDAMSLKQIGVDALSVPFGAGGGEKQSWIENEYDNLEIFDAVFLCMDQDEEGRKATAEIAERLGRHRCRVVDIGYKDANDALKDGMDIFDLQARILAARSLDPDELKSAGEYCDEVIREFYPPENMSTGFLTPWGKVGGSFRFRPGEVTVLAGYNGHGKTQGAGHICVDAMVQGEKACIASLEFKPRKLLRRMARQVAAEDEPSIKKLREVHEWYAGKLWIYDYCGVASADKLLTVFDYARRKYGIGLFIIDNLSKLNVSMERADEQAAFINRLMGFAKDSESHVILVAHMRKGEHEIKVGNKMDVKGSGAITDLADNCLIWWRNKQKEDKRREGDRSADNQPDAICQCTKQREGDDEPKIKLWFHAASYQFTETSTEPATNYLER